MKKTTKQIRTCKSDVRVPLAAAADNREVGFQIGCAVHICSRAVNNLSEEKRRTIAPEDGQNLGADAWITEHTRELETTRAHP